MRTLFTITALLVLTGCGASASQVSQGMHDALNGVTDYADPAYGMAVTSCHQAEQIALDRHDEAQPARERITRIRSRCDGIFAAFEVVRTQQQVLRRTADAVRDGSATVAELLGAVDELRGAVQAVTALVDAFRRDHGPPGINANEGDSTHE